MNVVVFDKSAQKFVIQAFGKDVDAEGFLVEKDHPKQRVISPDGIEIKETQFGGIKKGSEIYFGSDLVSIVHLFDSLAE